MSFKILQLEILNKIMIMDDVNKLSLINNFINNLDNQEIKEEKVNGEKKELKKIPRNVYKIRECVNPAIKVNIDEFKKYLSKKIKNKNSINQYINKAVNYLTDKQIIEKEYIKDQKKIPEQYTLRESNGLTRAAIGKWNMFCVKINMDDININETKYKKKDIFKKQLRKNFKDKEFTMEDVMKLKLPFRSKEPYYQANYTINQIFVKKDKIIENNKGKYRFI